MHQQISKKIIIYLFVFFTLGTYNNKQFSKFSLPKINNYNVVGLSKIENNQIFQDLSNLKNQTLFFLEKNKVSKIINTHKIVEKFYVFKNYPSNLNVIIERTNFLALIKKNGQDF